MYANVCGCGCMYKHAYTYIYKQTLEYLTEISSVERNGIYRWLFPGNNINKC